MFIDSTMNARPALQWSAMFLRQWAANSAYVSLLWSEEESLGDPHPINITSLRDGETGPLRT
jgi:hypothetical protein